MLTNTCLHTHCRVRSVRHTGRKCGATSLSRRDCVASSFDAGCKNSSPLDAAGSFGLCFGLKWPRRYLMQSFLTSVALLGASDLSAWAEGLVETSTISGKRGEYQITAPAAWTTTQKAGADILVISPDSKATNVGVTAVPVRVQTLAEFGSTSEVASKLLEAESKKESTISVDLLTSDSLTLTSGDTAYTFEYDLNSTRGRKRILNLVTISKARLYIVNGQCKCVEACPEDAVEQLRSIVSSFKLR